METYQVGPLGSEQDFFSASWLHDASGTPSPSGSVPAAQDNRAYRTGTTSSSITGSLYGDLDATQNVLSGIGGTLSGKTRYLLDDFNSSLNGKEFVLNLGKDAGSGKSGKLKFETSGAGQGEFTGGYIDFALSIVGGPANMLTGTFFFKPQAEMGSTPLTPNRGNSSAFTLWGYNWMHDSAPFGGGDAVNWATFMDSLQYGGPAVVRPTIVSDESNQTLGISLYVTSVNNSVNPEPTTLIVWGALSMIGLCYSRRSRRADAR